MSNKIIHTEKAPQPIGPYSQAVVANGLVFVSGQIAINPATGQMNMANIEVETKQVMDNLSSVLVAAGTSFSQIVKTTIFLSDMELFAQVNEIYGSYFAGNFPARETVAVKGLPKNVRVEISVIAQVI